MGLVTLCLMRQMVRIMQELSSLSNSLPLSHSSSVFVRADESKVNCLQALIIGYTPCVEPS